MVWPGWRDDVSDHCGDPRFGDGASDCRGALGEQRFPTNQLRFPGFFGFAAAVNNFNRLPELLTAVARRIAACATWHYFDDTGTIQLRQEQGSAQAFSENVYEAVGWPFGIKKHVDAATGHDNLAHCLCDRTAGVRA